MQEAAPRQRWVTQGGSAPPSAAPIGGGAPPLAACCAAAYERSNGIGEENSQTVWPSCSAQVAAGGGRRRQDAAGCGRMAQEGLHTTQGALRDPRLSRWGGHSVGRLAEGARHASARWGSRSGLWARKRKEEKRTMTGSPSPKSSALGAARELARDSVTERQQSPSLLKCCHGSEHLCAYVHALRSLPKRRTSC